MSKYTVGEATYVCNGCEMSGCPGHAMKVLMDCSTDSYIVEVDGVGWGAYDENYVHALMKCLTPPEPADHGLGLRQNKWLKEP